MNKSAYFINEWQDMAAQVDRAREALLNREQKEVYHEMIYQECQEGIKSRQKIANEYKVHLSTVQRIENRRRN